MPKGEIDARIDKVQARMKTGKIGGMLILQRVDLLYFSGTAQNAALYIPQEGSPLLMVKKYFSRAVQESSIAHIIEIQSVKEIPIKIQEAYGRMPDHIGVEMDVMPVREFNFYQSLFPAQVLMDGSALVLDVRMVKSSWEIQQMKKAAELSQKTFAYMTFVLRPGLQEMEFAGMVEAFARKYGHGGMLRVRDYQAEGYPWHVLSGENSGRLGLLDAPASGAGTSLAFPCGAGNKCLALDEPILVDFGTVLNGFHMDETRMFAMQSMPKKARDAAEASIKIHDAVLDRIRPGMAAGEIYEYSRVKAEEVGYADAFLGPPGYQVAFVGHGIGMELIEPPFLAKGKQQILEPGMTFALEPKIVFENEFMAGVESVFAVTENGSELISKVPVDVFIC